MLVCEVVALLTFSSIHVVIFLNIVSNCSSMQVSGLYNVFNITRNKSTRTRAEQITCKSLSYLESKFVKPHFYRKKMKKHTYSSVQMRFLIFYITAQFNNSLQFFKNLFTLIFFSVDIISTFSKNLSLLHWITLKVQNIPLYKISSVCPRSVVRKAILFLVAN